MKLPDHFAQRAKTGLHALQGFVIFLAWAITIAVFTKDGTTDGRTKYFFALVWEKLCAPNSSVTRLHVLEESYD